MSADVKLEEVDHDNDLPLLANASELRARHYLINLKVDLQRECFDGEVVILLENIALRDCDKCVLDCRHVQVKIVQQVAGNVEKPPCSSRTRTSAETMDKWFSLPRRDVPFTVKPWSVEIEAEFPVSTEGDISAVYIAYRTLPEAKSVLFRKDQAGKMCAFTAGASVNNRSLFPCQEPPEAMATWQATVQAPTPYKVFCTGDEAGRPLTEDRTYFFTTMVLPMSTFALAIGEWQVETLVDSEKKQRAEMRKTDAEVRVKCSHDPYPCHVLRGDDGPLIPCRLVGPSVMINLVLPAWRTYLRACLEAAYAYLGPHPFPRLDLIIVPRCFAGLGLASPCLVFLSQSLALKGGDAAMMVRIAHEISHSWFGLLVGALDWTEEWLSEVMATLTS